MIIKSREQSLSITIPPVAMKILSVRYGTEDERLITETFLAECVEADVDPQTEVVLLQQGRSSLG